jgi:hypothetical protein
MKKEYKKSRYGYRKSTYRSKENNRGFDTV